MGSDGQKGSAKMATWEPRGRGRRGLYSGLQAGQRGNMFPPLRLQSSNTPVLPATPHLVFPAAIYYPEGSHSGLQKSQTRLGHSLFLKSLPWLPITSGIESKHGSVLCNLSCAFLLSGDLVHVAWGSLNGLLMAGHVCILLQPLSRPHPHSLHRAPIMHL